MLCRRFHAFRKTPAPAGGLAGRLLAGCVAGALLLGLAGGCSPTVEGPSAAIYGPITVFGLSPQEGGASLLSEQVVFTDQDQVTMEYRVQLEDAASFLLPGTDLTGKRPEILVDGAAIDYSSEEHPTVYVTQPLGFSPGQDCGQSVHFSPNYMELGRQPDDSYRLLVNSIDASPAALSLTDRFLVYDLSGVETAPNDNTPMAAPSFSVTGNPQQCRLLFVNGACQIAQVDKDYEGAGSGTTSFYLTQSSARAASRIWLAIPEDESARSLLVTAGGQAMAARPMTLGEILAENPGVDEEDRPSFAANLNRRLAGAPLDGSATLVNSDAGLPFDRVSSQGRNMVKLYRFSIEHAGEHTITVRMDAAMAEQEAAPQALFAAAPADAWASSGERTAIFQVEGQEYAYPIGDTLLRFTTPPDALTSTTTS